MGTASQLADVAQQAVFVALGGRATSQAIQIVNFPGVVRFQQQRPRAPTPTGGTAGS